MEVRLPTSVRSETFWCSGLSHLVGVKVSRIRVCTALLWLAVLTCMEPWVAHPLSLSLHLLRCYSALWLAGSLRVTPMLAARSAPQKPLRPQAGGRAFSQDPLTFGAQRGAGGTAQEVGRGPVRRSPRMVLQVAGAPGSSFLACPSHLSQSCFQVSPAQP